MVARTAVLAGLVSLAGLAFGTAPALDEQSAPPPMRQSAFEGISLTEGDPDRALSLTYRDESAPRYAETRMNRTETMFRGDDGLRRRYEVALTAPGAAAGLDVELAQRASLGVDASGDVDRAGVGTEVRLGRIGTVVRPWRQRQEGSWYIFLASDGQALTWTAENALPGQRGLRLQDRVTIGDTQLGVSYERWGFQTSLALTQREVSYSNNTGGWSEDESFAGLTLTWRR
ncbi:MAG: hypothetical protein AB7J28_04310 [Hyphomonadaceae bacterium]